jgi:putative CocE/NonD family hydrolase
VREVLTGGLLMRARRRFDDLRWRATAVLDRLTLWWRLPPREADGWLRTSQYVTVRDGTTIAVDIYRPARRRRVLDGPFPVVWSFDRYHRARVENGRLWTRLDREFWLKSLVCRGYIVGVADVRGSGASFGSRAGLVVEQDRWDAYDITEWFAAQPWSTGRVGMCGKSFMGMTQYLAASAAPPHLVAIAPERTLFDLYAFAYAGGVFRDDYAREWSRNTDELDRIRRAAPVDADSSGEMLSAAIAEHHANVDIYERFSRLPLRDSIDARTGTCPYQTHAPPIHQREVSASGVAVLQFAGWHDMWPRDALLWHVNISNPRKLIVGPWAHTHDAGWKLFTERLRWFDYWLKGIENGVATEPPIRYYTSDASKGARWRTADRWPLPHQERAVFYCAQPVQDGTMGGGALTRQPPQSATGCDAYAVDYTTTSGSGTRWKNGYGQEFGYADMAPNDAKALTYTTTELEEDVELTGHPIVCLWVSASARDFDLFVYLEEVGPDGHSEYVSEGVLRASHRAVTDAPFDNLGLPYHSSTAETVDGLVGAEVVKLTFDLHPISKVFRRRRRIRIAITGADAGNALTPAMRSAPVVTVYRHQGFPSHVILPLIPRSSSRDRD